VVCLKNLVRAVFVFMDAGYITSLSVRSADAPGVESLFTLYPGMAGLNSQRFILL
jgi:hypothetical protein